MGHQRRDRVPAGWNVTATSTTFTAGAKTLSTAATTLTAAPTERLQRRVDLLGGHQLDHLPVHAARGVHCSHRHEGLQRRHEHRDGEPDRHADWKLSIPATTLAGTYTSTWTISLVGGRRTPETTEPMQILRTLGAVAVLAAVVVTVSGRAAVADPTGGGFGEAPAHLDPNQPTSRAYFQAVLTPGQTYRDEVVVTSTSDTPLSLLVSPVDGLTGQTWARCTPTGKRR